MRENEPLWVERLLQAFLRSVEWTSLKTPTHQTFTYKCQNIDGTWEISVSPWLHEIYGGKHDGAIKLPLYEMNLLEIMKEFNKVEFVGFDTDRLEATIDGEINMSWVSFRFRRLPPIPTNIRKKINIYTGEVTKILKSC